METILVVALIIYVAGALYGAWIGLTVLASADCDHAWLTLFPTVFVMVLFWPLAILFLLFLRVTGRDAS